METTISKLPPEMLVEIFSLLGQKDKASCSRVCRRWEAVSNTASLWQEEEARLDLDRVSFEVLCSVGKRQVGRVLVTSCSRPGSLQKLFLAHPNLTTVDVGPFRGDWSVKVVDTLNVPLAHLKVLTISLPDPATGLQFVSMIPSRLPHLESLTLSGDFPMDELCKSARCTLRKLKTLVLQSPSFTDSAMMHLAAMIPAADGPDSESCIEHLEIRSANALTYDTMDYVSQGFPSLKQLWFRECTFSEFQGFSFTSSLPELHTLGFPGCDFPEDTFNQSGVCSKSLLRLTLDCQKGVQGRDIIRVICSFPSLKELTVSEGLLSHKATMQVARRAPQLEKLWARGHFDFTRTELAKQGRGHLLGTITPLKNVETSLENLHL